MKQQNNILNLALVCTLLFILAAVRFPNASVQASQALQATGERTDCDSSRTVNVSGTAVVNVTPDRALIQLGVQSNGLTPSDVEMANEIAIQRVIKALHKLGIESRDIVTDRYIVEPIYESYDSLYIKGYRINNIVAVTLRDVSKINIVVVAALESSANQVLDVELYLGDLRKYRDQAREMAMVAAGEKARDLAKAAGADTGCVLNINENTWSYYNGWWSRNNRDLWTQNVMQNASSNGIMGNPADGGPVSLGQISVRAEVSASFALK